MSADCRRGAPPENRSFALRVAHGSAVACCEKNLRRSASNPRKSALKKISRVELRLAGALELSFDWRTEPSCKSVAFVSLLQSAPLAY
ncbi:MAG: hypothetical protein EAZ43_06210 [Betaproteobacteria bacterium]|nr:MAG: hypothetical protein EAZ43_06210 [Betaproteobacteria bacterium]